MIVVTGALGFIGSCLVRALNDAGHRDLIVVDDFYKDHKEPNLAGKWIRDWVHRDLFLDWFDRYAGEIDFVYHLGARTDTTSKDQPIFEALNLTYSKNIWNLCSKFDIPLVYASSAATYGLGEQGFSDEHENIAQFKPLNAYAISKQQFDIWALQQDQRPSRWQGLKFFNVYGPNEYHKGRMASVVFHAFNQVKKHGRVRLFRSHRSGIADGQQSRDFVYVKDVTAVCLYLLSNHVSNGIYNLGTGLARPFVDLATSVFTALEEEVNIEWIDTPEDIRETYQYFTEAKMEKLIAVGYSGSFTSLEDGVSDYVRNYLDTGKHW